jgi:hypothetical protein
MARKLERRSGEGAGLLDAGAGAADMATAIKREPVFEVWNLDVDGRHAYNAYGEARWDVSEALQRVDYGQPVVRVRTFHDRHQRRRIVQLVAGLDACEQGYRNVVTLYRCAVCDAEFPAPHFADCTL